MSALTIVLFVFGLVLLVVGAEVLVRGAARLAAAAGISSLVIGLTVVAFGTSTPELAVTLQGQLAGRPGLAVGNIVGSNIFNVLVILGLSALVTPLPVGRQLVRLEVPIMILCSVAMLLMGLDGVVGRVDGVLLLGAGFAYTWYTLRKGKAEDSPGLAEGLPGKGKAPRSVPSVLYQLLLIVVGIAMLVTGAGWLVQGAVTMAQALGVSELIIALTIVAAGTSSPEVATSVVAAIRGERDIAVGNAIGSCILNIVLVLGLSATVGNGIEVPHAALTLDIPVMVAVAFACLPVFFTGHLIDRWEGAVFLGYYVAYTAYLILKSLEHESLPAFNAVMLMFVIPLTVITLGVFAIRTLRKTHREAKARDGA